MGITKILNRAGDMFMPKELAPYAGTIGAMIAPVAPITGLMLGQLGSAKLNDGKLDPMQALAVGLGYYGGGGPQNRAEGKLFGQRMGRGIEGINIGGPSPTGGRFDAFKSGFTTDYTKNASLIPKGETLESRYDEYLGKVDKKEGSAYDKEFNKQQDAFNKQEDIRQDAFNKNQKDIRVDIASKQSQIAQQDQLIELTKANGGDTTILQSKRSKLANELFDLNIETFGEDFVRKDFGGPDIDPKEMMSFRNRTGLGNVEDLAQGIGEIVMPGFKGADGKFDPVKALTTVATAGTLTQLALAAEEIKKQKALDKAEEGKIWKEWFDGYKRVSGRDYIDSQYPDPTLTEKYKQFMATGGRVGYNTGGDTGIIAAAPGMPEGMQLDGRDGMFISQGVAEKADDVPAMLSKNEFVLTADAMKGFDKMTGGDGNPRSAAQKMYEMMNQMEAIA